MALGHSVGGGGGASDYDSLTDTPASKSGEARKRVKVNSGETAHEYFTDPEINLIADYGAVGDGSTDDTTALNNAIAAIPTTGGTIIIPATANGYKISSTIIGLDRPIIFRGVGGTSVNPNSKVLRGPRFVWAGGASAMFFVDGSGTSYEETGVKFENLGLDCNSTATYGIDCDRWMWGGCTNVRIVKAATAAMRLNVVVGAPANINTMWNTFKDMFLDGPIGMILDSDVIGGVANVAHNKFENIQVIYTNIGIKLEDCDNNWFGMIFTFTSGSGFGMTFGARARANYVYQLQPGSGGVSSATSFGGGNIIFGYDRENGQPAPTITGGTLPLTWFEGGALGKGSQLAQYNYTEATLPGASSVKAGTIVHVTDADDLMQFSDGAVWAALGGGGLGADVDGGLFTDEAAENSLTVDGGTFV